MAINEQWLPIIAEAISWIKDKTGPSKKELRVQVSELEKRIGALTSENTLLANNLGLIIQATLKQLSSDNRFSVNADTIVFVGENTGTFDVSKPVFQDSPISGSFIAKEQVLNYDVSKIFDGLDEEITHSRTTKPSDRR